MKTLILNNKEVPFFDFNKIGKYDCIFIIGISQIVKTFDTKERLGGTLSSIIFALSQGVQVFRVHNVAEVKQGILVFKKLLN